MYILLIQIFCLVFVSGQLLPTLPCDPGIIDECLDNVTEPWVHDIVKGKLSVITTLDIDQACSTLDKMYHCMEGHLKTCNYGLRLVFATVAASATFICNRGKQGFINNAQCITDTAVISGLETCTTSLLNTFPNIYNISLDIQRNEICGHLKTWSQCMPDSVMQNCDDSALMYIYSLIEATLQPGRRLLLCPIDTKACLSSPCQNGAVCLSLMGLDYECQCFGNFSGKNCEIEYSQDENSNNQNMTDFFTTMIQEVTTIPDGNSTACDIEGTGQCLRSVQQGALSNFATMQFISVQQIETLCWALEDAYTCIGTKLDNCSPEIRLFRDIIVKGAKFLCNSKKSQLVEDIQCIQTMTDQNLTANCLNDISRDFAQFFSGGKSIFDHSQEFCSVASRWSSCYMRTVERVCDPKAYLFTYNYVKFTMEPVKTELQCDLLSGVPKCPVYLCLNGGTCLVDQSGLRCLCHPSFNGSRCETNGMPEPEPEANVTEATLPEPEPTITADSCSSSPCYYGGTCIPKENGFTCVCLQGLFGARCGVGVGGCPGFPCYNGASCFTDDNGPRCLCPSDLSGPHCEDVPVSPTTNLVTVPVDSCSSSPCFYGAPCTPIANDFKCNCPPNLFGKRCGMGNGGCPGLKCFNGGTCKTDDNGPQCMCTPGVSGTNCEISDSTPLPEPEPTITTDYCSSSPCHHGGTCIPQENGFTCVCQKGFFGLRCEAVVWGCPGFPCYNGGSCFTDDNGTRCLCPSDLSGPHCEGNTSVSTTPESTVPVDSCLSSPCFYGASCIPEFNDFTCVCPPNLFGRRCGIGNGGCPGFKCHNGGTCFTDDSGARCLCTFGNSGTYCEIRNGFPTPELTTAAPEITTTTEKVTTIPTEEVTTTRKVTTQTPSRQKCWYIGRRPGRGRWNRWCNNNCNRGYCPSDYCRCKDRPNPVRCHAIGQYRKMGGMNDWCNNNCIGSYCPRNICRCRGGNKG